MWFTVASPSNPPKVTVGGKLVKYIKIIEANDCNEKLSTKFLLRSLSFNILNKTTKESTTSPEVGQ